VSHSHAVGALGPVAGAGEEVGFAEGDGEEGADGDGEDGEADVVGLPFVVAGEEGAEELCRMI